MSHFMPGFTHVSRLLNETAWIIQAHSNTGNAGIDELSGAHGPCATQNALD